MLVCIALLATLMACGAGRGASNTGAGGGACPDSISMAGCFQEPVAVLATGPGAGGVWPAGTTALTVTTDVSGVLDNSSRRLIRIGESTATLTNVPIDTAVRLLADMAGLQVIQVDNVLYVTTPENATRFAAELQKRYLIAPTLGGM